MVPRAVQNIRIHLISQAVDVVIRIGPVPHLKALTGGRVSRVFVPGERVAPSRGVGKGGLLPGLKAGYLLIPCRRPSIVVLLHLVHKDLEIPLILAIPACSICC